jgi:hypothetical protein
MKDTETQTLTNKFLVKAIHPAFGEVVIAIPAADRKEAFSKFKSIVFSHTQWRIVSNDEARP